MTPSCNARLSGLLLPLIALMALIAGGCSQPAGDAGAANPPAAKLDPVMARGEGVYYANCVACHLPAGTGLEGAFPPLAGSDFLDDRDKVIATVLYFLGSSGTINITLEGAAQATGAGLSIFIGGAIRDLVNHAAGNGVLGEALATPATGYSVVYHTEIGLLFITLIVLGPLVRTRRLGTGDTAKLGLADFPT